MNYLLMITIIISMGCLTYKGDEGLDILGQENQGVDLSEILPLSLYGGNLQSIYR